MTDHFYDGGGLSQTARGVDPRDRADAGGDGVTADDRRAAIHALARDDLHSMAELLAAEYPPSDDGDDADPEDGKPPECQRADCSGLQRDGFAGCCSMKCAMENADESAADVPNAQRDAEDSELTPGTRIQCNEARAESPQHDFGESGIGARHPRFTALVDSVQGEYVEATVTRRNPHARSPDPGAHLALSATSIREEARWRVEDGESR